MKRNTLAYMILCLVVTGCGQEGVRPLNLSPSGGAHNGNSTKVLSPPDDCAKVNGTPLKIVSSGDVHCFDVPNGTGKRIGTLPMFQIMYVIDPPNRFSNGDEMEWLKISPTRSEVDAFYIQAYWDKNVYPWPHRVAWYAVKTSAIVQQDVYGLFDDLARSIRGEYVSPIGSVTLRPQRLSEFPYPILEMKRITAEDGTQYDCYKVAFLGRHENRMSTGKVQTVAYTRQETTQIIDQLRAIDVLVVLDVTGSMSKHFSTAQKSIREFAETFKSKNLRPRFKLTTYKDIDEIDVYPWEDIEKFCGRINGLDSDGGGDEEESVYPAMHETLTRTTFRERSERIMLLVGDSPSHTRGVNNPTRIGNDEIIRLGKRHKVKVFVAAVSEGRALEKQMRGIAEATGGESIALTQKSELFRHVRKMLQTTSDSASNYVQVAEKMFEGKTMDEIKNEIGKDLAPIVDLILTEKGIDLDKLPALQRGETICATGWIRCPRNGATAGRLEVFGFKTEFEATLGVMQTIANLSPGHKTMLDIQIEGFGSRVRTDVPIGKFMDEYGLPHSNPSLLGLTMGEIMLLTEQERASIKDALRSKINRLKDELNEKARWRRLSDNDERIIGHVSESCLP